MYLISSVEVSKLELKKRKEFGLELDQFSWSESFFLGGAMNLASSVGMNEL